MAGGTLCGKFTHVNAKMHFVGFFPTIGVALPSQPRYQSLAMQDPARPPPPETLLRASRRLLRPLVRLLMRAGVTFPVLAELMRTLYVEVAANDLLTDPGARTDSRVSLMTGVHRKELRRLRQLPADADPIPQAVTVGGHIVARWLGMPEYADRDGNPLPLPRVAFDTLVESVTTDVRPRAVLDDWVGQGIASVDAADCVHLNAAAFLPRPGGEEQMFYFARNLHDHIAAATANATAASAPPFVDRAVHYDGLDDATAAALEDVARRAAQQVVLDVNRAAIALVDAAPLGGAPAKGRVNFGVYVYRDEDTE